MKCLISDFDGTLYDDNFINNIKSVREFVATGNSFIINTGRTFENIKRAISSYDIPYKYLICSDGAAIYNENDEMIYSKYLSDDIKKEIISFLKSHIEIKKRAYDNNYMLTDNSDEKISRCFGTTLDKKKDQILADELNQKPYLKAYLSTYWINVLDKKINKKEAIKYLEPSLGQIYSVGDSINDIEMLQSYHGYVMAKNEIGDCDLPVVLSVEELINKILKDT